MVFLTYTLMTNLDMYRVSSFRWFYRVSRLLVKLEGCGFRGTVLLFYEMKDATNRITPAVFVFEIQGDFKKVAFLDPPRI